MGSTVAVKTDDLSDPERKLLCVCQESLVGIKDEAILHKIATPVAVL